MGVGSLPPAIYCGAGVDDYLSFEEREALIKKEKERDKGGDKSQRENGKRETEKEK